MTSMSQHDTDTSAVRGEPNPCEVCGGEGTLPVLDIKMHARYSVSCPDCGGTGTIYADGVER